MTPGVAPAGSLEELDGTPILPSGPAEAGVRPTPAAVVPWWRGAAAATALTVRAPALWPAALVAFLARGGLALLAFPVVVLPTLLGISNFVGPASVTASGPGPRLVALLVAAVVVVAILAVVGTVLAAAGEAAFLRASGPSIRARLAGSPLPRSAALRQAVVRVAAIRLTLLVPVAAAAAAAVPAWVAAGYRELTLPSDLAVPLVVRIATGAPAATALVAVAWLAGELVGGFAARRAVLLDRPWPRALGAALLDPVRAPGGALLTVAAAVGVGAIALAPAIALLAAAWAIVRQPLVDEGVSPAAAGGAIVLVAAWLVALGMAAAAAAWRGHLATAEVLRHASPGRRHSGEGPPVR